MRTTAMSGIAIALVFPMVLLAVDQSKESIRSVGKKYHPVTYNVADLPVWRNNGKQSPEFAPELLIKYLRATVEPKSWTTGAEIRPIPLKASLVISQTEANHKKIAEAVDSFRKNDAREQREQQAVARPPVNVGDFVPALRRDQSSIR